MTAHLGVFIALAMVPIDLYVLIYRTTLGFEIRTVGANPSAARYAGMSPRRLIILTLSLCRPPCRPGRCDRDPGPGVTTRRVRTNDRLRGHHGRAARSRSTRSASSSRALLLGGMRAGSAAMQIEADIPPEIIDVIQGLILLFLAAEVVIGRVFRIRAEAAGTLDELQTVSTQLRPGQRLMGISCTTSRSSGSSSRSSATSSTRS